MAQEFSAPKHYGFGTTLIERTLDVHGGEGSILYKSDGITATIRLPLHEEDTMRLPLPQEDNEQNVTLKRLPAEGARTVATSSVSRLSGKRVMVVEDEPLLSMDLESTLRDMGCEVAGSAGTIEEARSLVARADCDAALLNVNLAGHPVDELAAALTRKNIPFAFVTGYGRSGVPAGFREGLVLDKPFNETQLRAVLERLLHPGGDVVQFRQSS